MEELKQKIADIDAKIQELYQLLELEEGVYREPSEASIMSLVNKREKLTKELDDLIMVKQIDEKRQLNAEYIVIVMPKHIKMIFTQECKHSRMCKFYRNNPAYTSCPCYVDFKTFDQGPDEANCRKMVIYLLSKGIKYPTKKSTYNQKFTFDIILTYYGINGYMLELIKDNTMQFVKKEHTCRMYRYDGMFSHVYYHNCEVKMVKFDLVKDDTYLRLINEASVI